MSHWLPNSSRFLPAADWNRWPKTGAWLNRVNEQTALGELASVAVQLLKIPPPQHRDRLIELGFDVVAGSVGSNAPRPSLMLG